MLADDVACNTRNKFPGSVYAKAGRHLDLYGDNIEVDYRGYEVTVENFIRLLTGMSMFNAFSPDQRSIQDESTRLYRVPNDCSRTTAPISSYT